MPITCVQGDIFTQQADALVVPGNIQPELGWGSHIAHRLERMVDPQVLEQRRALGSIKLGDAAFTSGVGSPFKHLIHASVLDQFDFNPLFLLRIRQRTSDATLRAAVRSSRHIAEHEGWNQVAVSAMGAGIGGMNYAKCCRLTFAELQGSATQWLFTAYRPRHLRIAERVHQAFNGEAPGNG